MAGARSGGFGGSLNPFGTGNAGGFTQYDIGSDLADLEVYRVEVAWGNGKATDDEYLAALTKARDATDVDTQKRETAQNKLDDAVYRIGRSRVEGDLDALIAFDQRTLATMNPNNLRYRDVKDSLDSELAGRRSRDYGRVVDEYNAGKMSTEALLGWVQSHTGGLSPDDPDYEQWQGVRTDLAERLVSEKDAKVYQDFQNRRMKPAEFLAYVTSRRDSYDPSSPKWAEWDRKLEDATDNVRDTAQAAKDSAFFNRYEEGKVSDKAYLKYLRDRIAGMEPGDPSIGEWKHRLHQAAFSLAEDKLRYDVTRGRAKVGALIDFYRDYRHTLNPGSAEYRQITLQILSLKKQDGAGGGGGGRGGGGGGSSTTAGSGGALGHTEPGKSTAQERSLDKLIDPKNTIKGLAGNLFVIDPTANKKSIAKAAGFLRLNIASAGNAVRQGDAVWLFHDPRHPNDRVAGRYPDGSPMLDAKGNPVMVPGSSYLPASNEIYSNLKSIEGSNWMGAAQVALANKDVTHYAQYLRSAEEAWDQARTADAQFRGQNWQDWYDATSKGVDELTRQGRYGEAAAMARDLAVRLAQESANPYLDDTRRKDLDQLGAKLEANPLLTTFDDQGNVVRQGALNLQALAAGQTVLNPGWHTVLKSTQTGAADYGPVFDDRQDGTWEATHVTVNTTYGGEIVTGEVSLSNAPTNPNLVVRTPTGQKTIEFPGSSQFFAFQDENGKTVRSYSVDGIHWITPGNGQPPPALEVNVDLAERDGPNGTVQLIDEATGEVVFELDANGAWQGSDYLLNNPGAVGWYGQAAIDSARVGLSPYDPRERDEMRTVLLQKEAGLDLGAPGQRMAFTTIGANGTINLSGASFTAGLIDVDMRGDRPRRTSEDILKSAAAHDREPGTTLKPAPQPIYTGVPTSHAPNGIVNTGVPVPARGGAGNLEDAFHPPAKLPPPSPDRADGGGTSLPGLPLYTGVPIPTLAKVSTVLPGLVKGKKVAVPVVKKAAPKPVVKPTKAPNKAAVKKATTAGITYTGIPVPPKPKTPSAKAPTMK